MSDPYIFAQAIVKFLLVTGIGPGIVLALLMEDLARFAERQRNRRMAVVIRFPRRNQLGRSTTSRSRRVSLIEGAYRPSLSRRAR